jgi:hypothetical protein
MPLEHPLTRLRVVDPNLGTSENCSEGAYLRPDGAEVQVAGGLSSCTFCMTSVPSEEEAKTRPCPAVKSGTRHFFQRLRAMHALTRSGPQLKKDSRPGS